MLKHLNSILSKGQECLIGTIASSKAHTREAVIPAPKPRATLAREVIKHLTLLITEIIMIRTTLIKLLLYMILVGATSLMTRFYGDGNPTMKWKLHLENHYSNSCRKSLQERAT